MKNPVFISCAFALAIITLTTWLNGNAQSSTDYKTVKIGGQIWMAENLSVDKFRNGDTIPYAETGEAWKAAGENKQPAWCYYDNDPANGSKYGRLYNWYAVNDPRGLAPAGWKIPSDDDLVELRHFLGGPYVAGAKLKSTAFWVDHSGKSGNGNNESGFNGLPAGYRNPDGYFFNFDFGKYGHWWSSAVCDVYNAPWCLKLVYYDNLAHIEYYDEGWGFYVRCLSDQLRNDN